MDKKYKFSDYLTLVPHKDEYLIAQGILGKFLRIKKKLFDEVGRNLNKKGSPEIERAKSGLRTILAVVPEEFNEQELIKGLFYLGLETAKKICDITLVLTLRCNFSCVYCFEMEKKADMNKEIIDKALKDLFKRVRKYKRKSIDITFSGGEPLLLPDKLEYAVQKVRAFCKKNRIKPVFTIVTNGSVLNPRIVRLFQEKEDLSKVQITLDGPQEIHDRRRMFKSGMGSYEVIMKNIPRWMRLAQEVLIRINVDRENAAHIPQLLEVLSKWKKKNLFIRPSMVTEDAGRGARRSKGLDFFGFEVLGSKYYTLARKIGLQMQKLPLPYFKPYCCAANAAHPTWISPDGERHCCDNELRNKSWSVGNVFSGINERKAKKWCKYSVLNIEKCLKCKHVFFCGGPCPFELRRGILNNYLCGNNFKRILQKNLKEIFVSLKRI